MDTDIQTSHNFQVSQNVLLQPFKTNVKTILRAAQKEAEGWIWPAGQSLPTPTLDNGLQGFCEAGKMQSSSV